MSTPTWINLCCGMAATEARAMTGRFVPVSRIGGKRGYADGVLDILGAWPKRWLLVDSDPAIVEFWQAAFLGLLPAVAEVIRNAPADGEELWKLWTSEPVPVDPVERVARWVVISKGNYSGKPVSWRGDRWRCYDGGMGIVEWQGVAGFMKQGRASIAAGFPEERHKKDATARRLVEWQGVAGFMKQGPAAIAAGYPLSTVNKGPLADRLGEWQGIAGFKGASESERGRWSTWEPLPRDATALLLDLTTSSPVVHPGDLVTIDPPYRGTTGYRDSLHRDRVVEIAQEAHERGARVLVHEAEPVIEGGPWRAVELPRTHGGKQRTWSKQQSEWVSLNFEPKGQQRLCY